MYASILNCKYMYHRLPIVKECTINSSSLILAHVVVTLPVIKLEFMKFSSHFVKNHKSFLPLKFGASYVTIWYVNYVSPSGSGPSPINAAGGRPSPINAGW